MGKVLRLAAAGAFCSVACTLAQTNVLYETHFERAEGYTALDRDLAGQNGWVMDGTGGNGLIDGRFQGFGQQAYIGFVAPKDTNAVTSVWRPIGFDPSTNNSSVIRFTVKFEIVPSTKGSQDDFRWSVYNKAGNRLFSVDFESSTGVISYILQDGKFVNAGPTLNFDGFYDLDIWMDFRRNLWTAYLDDFILINSQPLTQQNSPLNFGDADAVWFVRGPANTAGDNFMAFDNYRITAENLTSIPGFVQAQGVDTNGFFNFRAFGEKGLKYSVEVSSDFVQWFSLGEYTNAEGSFDFTDNTTKGTKRGYYRLRQVQ